MSHPVCSCAEQVRKLTQQAPVMRREIKNLRQQMDGAIRAHKKQMSSLQSMLTDCKHEDKLQSVSKSPSEIKLLLEQGRIQTVPIGYISSCFAVKNGTPRQPTICSSSRATLKIEPSVFNNPEHSLVGLEQYSHIWIIFLFHKNGQMNYKAKVKPPRLNGQRVGVYSTRSPHRPNALGLTLAKLEGITGTTYLQD
ncbi:tRNA (adenine(37)-N6)-methyltransferase [Sinocyclocheilus grahami]|uniref:tRNA (adenine(37)-N6)-methyltransferase n=1 Tax=Sinocyclocheilus grahami TaxID=75366 RepID=UPI0007ACF9AD|nr:PREDICTED: tRNA (adenine(37)-N6)-methyltransferase [Sinocyclocheilus grahami]